MTTKRNSFAVDISHFIFGLFNYAIDIIKKYMTYNKCFENTYELVNLGAVMNIDFSTNYRYFNVWIRYFVWNFKG